MTSSLSTDSRSIDDLVAAAPPRLSGREKPYLGHEGERRVRERSERESGREKPYVVPTPAVAGVTHTRPPWISMMR